MAVDRRCFLNHCLRQVAHGGVALTAAADAFAALQPEKQIQSAPVQAATSAPLTSPAHASTAIEHVRLPDATVHVTWPDGLSPAIRALALTWIHRSAMAVQHYFGRFPVHRLQLQLRSFDGGGVSSGLTSMDAAPFVRIRVGSETSATQFEGDWVLVHELIHLAVPRLARRHNWLHEGIATYAEGVARTRAGILTATTFWNELATAMPQGLPQAADRGLDHTPTWGRTYWGGAMFCLLADVRLRQLTGNRAGLQQALQGVLAAGGSYAVQWPVEQVLGEGDKAVGQPVLMDLYHSMKDTPVAVDLAAIWRDLGVGTGGGNSLLNDGARHAAIRQAIAA